MKKYGREQRKELLRKDVRWRKVVKACLKCDQPFKPASKSNRVCADCKRERCWTSPVTVHGL